MNFAIKPSAQAVVPIVADTAVFPVRRIYCVGQNYAEHVKEMGGDPTKTLPVFFSKPADAIVTDGKPISYPQATENLHYEAELVVALKGGGRYLSTQQAKECVFGYAVGIDFTRRDLQAKCKSKGQPWDVAKGFDQSAPISAIKPAQECVGVDESRIWLSVNEVIKQDANTNDLIWNVPAILAELSKYFELCAGDLIFTGTPSGVSEVVAGDKIVAAVEGVGQLQVEILPSEKI